VVPPPLQTLCFRGKCLLTCLYGRVEVLGFTIEEGQQPYPLFSPASHCPLTVTALGGTDDARDEMMEASAILRKYLTPGEEKQKRAVLPPPVLTTFHLGHCRHWRGVNLSVAPGSSLILGVTIRFEIHSRFVVISRFQIQSRFST